MRTISKRTISNGLFAATLAVIVVINGCKSEGGGGGFLDNVGKVAGNIGNTIGGEVGTWFGVAERLSGPAGKALEGGQFNDYDEYHLGRAAASQIIQQYGLFKDDQATAYLNLIGHTLVELSNARATYAGYHFAVLNSDEVNAFACPGAYIFVTRGMLRLCASEDELAAVLAHEIAHIDKRHALQSIESKRWNDLLVAVGQEGARQANAGPLADVGADMAGDVHKTLTTSGYSQKLETEADKESVRILRAAGYEPSAMVNVLTKMDQELKTNTGGFGKTHPHTRDRIDVVKREVGNTIPKPLVRERQARFDRALALSRSKG